MVDQASDDLMIRHPLDAQKRSNPEAVGRAKVRLSRHSWDCHGHHFRHRFTTATLRIDATTNTHIIIPLHFESRRFVVTTKTP